MKLQLSKLLGSFGIALLLFACGNSDPDTTSNTTTESNQEELISAEDSVHIYEDGRTSPATVWDVPSNAAMVGATITASIGGTLKSSTTSGQGGAYNFTNPPLVTGTTYIYTATKAGYHCRPSSQSAMYSGSTSSLPNIQMVQDTV